MGTIPYMSPEHIGREGVDARTDIYALGLIVHEMLAGRHPFAGESGGFPSLDQMIMMQLTREPDDLTNSIGAAVWRTLEPALAKKKDQRYATMTAFGDALRSARMQFTGEAPAIDAFPSTTQPSAAGSNPSSQTAAPHSPAAPQSAAAPPRYDPNAQVTPPPLEASTTPPRTGGIGKGGLLTLALLAAIVGAGVVVFVARTTTIAGTPAADVEAPSDDSDRKKRKKRRAKGEDDDAATSSAKPTGSANTSGASSAATTGEAVDAGVASTTSTGTTLSPPAKRGTPGTGAGSGHGAPAKSAPANTPRPGPRPPSDDGEIF